MVDTFLIYKIAETGYNRKVAFTAAILFAVMPSSWLMRSVTFRNFTTTFDSFVDIICNVL